MVKSFTSPWDLYGVQPETFKRDDLGSYRYKSEYTLFLSYVCTPITSPFTDFLLVQVPLGPLVPVLVRVTAE